MLKSHDGRELWIVTKGGIGHAIVGRDPVVAACGRSGWTKSIVIDRRPRHVCSACADAIDATTRSGGVRETQGSLF